MSDPHLRRCIAALLRAGARGRQMMLEALGPVVQERELRFLGLDWHRFVTGVESTEDGSLILDVALNEQIYADPQPLRCRLQIMPWGTIVIQLPPQVHRGEDPDTERYDTAAVVEQSEGRGRIFVYHAPSGQYTHAITVWPEFREDERRLP